MDTKFFSAIRTRLIERTSDNWHQYYGLLESYKNTFKDCLVPVSYTIENWSLGRWVRSQRQKKNRGELNEERVDLLNQLGFVWSVPEYEWQLALKYLRSYKNEFGDCLVPNFYKVDGYPLGSFVHGLRPKRSSLPERKKRT